MGGGNEDVGGLPDVGSLDPLAQALAKAEAYRQAQNPYPILEQAMGALDHPQAYPILSSPYGKQMISSGSPNEQNWDSPMSQILRESAGAVGKGAFNMLDKRRQLADQTDAVNAMAQMFGSKDPDNLDTSGIDPALVGPLSSGLKLFQLEQGAQLYQARQKAAIEAGKQKGIDVNKAMADAIAQNPQQAALIRQAFGTAGNDATPDNPNLSPAEQVLRKVPIKDQGEAFKEVASTDQVNRMLDRLDESFDAAKTVPREARALASVHIPYLDIGLPPTDNMAKYKLSQANTLGGLQAITTTLRMNPQELEFLKTYIPGAFDSDSVIDQKKIELRKQILARQQGTPISQAFGVDTKASSGSNNNIFALQDMAAKDPAIKAAILAELQKRGS